jgi:hypothetical protein
MFEWHVTFSMALAVESRSEIQNSRSAIRATFRPDSGRLLTNSENTQQKLLKNRRLRSSGSQHRDSYKIHEDLIAFRRLWPVRKRRPRRHQESWFSEDLMDILVFLHHRHLIQDRICRYSADGLSITGIFIVVGSAEWIASR